jgi:hypothetical protein
MRGFEIRGLRNSLVACWRMTAPPLSAVSWPAPPAGPSAGMERLAIRGSRFQGSGFWNQKPVQKPSGESRICLHVHVLGDICRSFSCPICRVKVGRFGALSLVQNRGGSRVPGFIAPYPLKSHLGSICRLRSLRVSEPCIDMLQSKFVTSSCLCD